MSAPCGRGAPRWDLAFPELCDDGAQALSTFLLKSVLILKAQGHPSKKRKKKKEKKKHILKEHLFPVSFRPLYFSLPVSLPHRPSFPSTLDVFVFTHCAFGSDF